MGVFDFLFTGGLGCVCLAIIILLAAHTLYYKTSMSHIKLRVMALLAYYIGMLGLIIAILSSIIELFVK